MLSRRKHGTRRRAGSGGGNGLLLLRNELQFKHPTSNEFHQGKGGMSPEGSVTDRPTVLQPSNFAVALDAAPPETYRHAAAGALVGDYELLGKLGQGGTGVVYRARQRSLNRIVALKMILAGAHAEPKLLARFKAEAEVVARLTHPNIVQVHEVGTFDGLPFFSLEYVDGGTLAQHTAGAPQPPRRAAELVETIARAVHHAHQQGILHRDLKPANILLTAGGAPKVADFGLAKRLPGGPGTPAGLTTETGAILGTPAYMAPEQALPGGWEQVGPAADVYGLGAILYELLAGRPPFQAPSAFGVVQQVLGDEPVSLSRLRPQVPRDLEVITHKCLRKEPDQRYASALELADDLHCYLAGEPVRACPPSRLYRWGKFVRRNKALVAGLTGVAVALLLGTVVSLLFALGEARQRVVAEDARQAARREAYQARVAAAVAALGNHDVAEAARQLDAAPEGLRGWEWSHLHARLDDSLLRAGAEDLDRLAGAWPVVTVRGSRRPVLSTVSNRCITHLPNNTHGFLARTRKGPLVFIDREGEPLWLQDESGGRRVTFSPKHGGTHALSVSPDGTRLAAQFEEAPDRHRIRVFALPSGKEQAQLPGLPGARSLAISPDGKRIAIVGESGSAWLWQLGAKEEARELLGHTGAINCVTFSPDGGRLLTAAEDRTLRQWDGRTGDVLDTRHGHLDEVIAADYSPDGRWFASSSRDGTVRLWNAADGEATAIFRGHTTPVLQVAFSPDGKTLASAASSEVRIWDVSCRCDPRVLRHKSYVYPVVFSPDGRWIASGGWDKVVRLWDAATGKPLGVLAGHASWVAALAVSPDGKTLVSRGYDNTLRLWDVETKKLQRVIPAGKIYLHGWVHQVAISPDGTWLVLGEGDRLRRWHLPTGCEDESFRVPGVSLRLATFSPDGSRLAVAGPDGGGARWLEEDSAVHLLDAQDGRRLVSAGEDRTVRLWDVEEAQERMVLLGHTDEIFAAAFHPDGSRFVTAGRDRIIRVWDAETGELLVGLSGHTNYVFSLVFSPDGKTLVSGSGDNTVRLWDTFPLSRRLRAR